PQEGARADLHGDPLPPGAVARLGTVRFRHENWVGPFATSPDGRALAAVAGTSLAVWDAATGRPLRRFALDADLHCLAFAPDGTSVAGGADAGGVRLLDLASGQETRRCVGHRAAGDRFSRGVWGAAFTPDGQTLLTWGSDQTVRLWDARSGKELRRFGDKDWTVHGLSPDGKIL